MRKSADQGKTFSYGEKQTSRYTFEIINNYYIHLKPEAHI